MRVRLLHIILLWFLQSGPAAAQDTLRILFAGDIMMHGPQIQAARQNDGSFDFLHSFRHLKSLFRHADAVVGNLETTLVKKNFTGYPRFGAPDTLAYQLRQAGFTHLVTANNHSCDRGRHGILHTVETLDKAGIRHTGTGKKPRTETGETVIEKGNIRLALLNYTYGTNGIAVPRGTYVNLIDTVRMKKDIRRIRRTGRYDDIVVFLHWGTQYRYQPDTFQKKIEKFLHRQGIRYIIGSHPHIVQPVRRDSARHRLTAYSLGNFISNQRDFPRDGSMLLELTFVKNNEGIRLHKLTYIPVWTYKGMYNGKTFFEVLPARRFVLQDFYFHHSRSHEKMIKYLAHLDRIMKDSGIPPASGPPLIGNLLHMPRPRLYMKPALTFRPREE